MEWIPPTFILLLQGSETEEVTTRLFNWAATHKIYPTSVLEMQWHLHVRQLHLEFSNGAVYIMWETVGSYYSLQQIVRQERNNGPQIMWASPPLQWLMGLRLCLSCTSLSQPIIPDQMWPVSMTINEWMQPFASTWVREPVIRVPNLCSDHNIAVAEACTMHDYEFPQVKQAPLMVFPQQTKEQKWAL